MLWLTTSAPRRLGTSLKRHNFRQSWDQWPQGLGGTAWTGRQSFRAGTRLDAAALRICALTCSSNSKHKPSRGPTCPSIPGVCLYPRREAYSGRPPPGLHQGKAGCSCICIHLKDSFLSLPHCVFFFLWSTDSPSMVWNSKISTHPIFCLILQSWS